MTEPAARLAPRGDLPPGCRPYRTIGPFDEHTLPAGLKAEHRLKPGAWALVQLSAGTIRFAWDDPEGGSQTLSAPAEIVVPPQVPHHVEADGAFTLTIAFHAA